MAANPVAAAPGAPVPAVVAGRGAAVVVAADHLHKLVDHLPNSMVVVVDINNSNNMHRQLVDLVNGSGSGFTASLSQREERRLKKERIRMREKKEKKREREME